MIHRERSVGAALSKPIPAFFPSPFSADSHYPLLLSLSPCKGVTANHLLSSLRLCCLLCLSSPASMGTEVNHAQQDFWLCHRFLSVTTPNSRQLLPCAIYVTFCYKNTESSDNLWTWMLCLMCSLQGTSSTGHSCKIPMQKNGKNYQNIPALDLILSLNSSLAPPPAMSPGDAIVAN